MDRRRVIQVQVRERLLHSFCGLPCIVVWDLVVDVMYDVRGANAVVEEVEDRAVRAVDRHECAFGPRPAFLVEVRHVDVRVLQPGVQHKPHVGEGEGQEVEEGGRLPAGDGAPCTERTKHRGNAVVRPVYLQCSRGPR